VPWWCKATFWLHDSMIIFETEPAGGRCYSAKNALSTYLTPFIRWVRADTRRIHFYSTGLFPLTFTVWSEIPSACVKYCTEMETYNHLCNLFLQGPFFNCTTIQKFGFCYHFKCVWKKSRMLSKVAFIPFVFLGFFYHRSESDPDVVYFKNTIFSILSSKLNFF